MGFLFEGAMPAPPHRRSDGEARNGQCGCLNERQRASRAERPAGRHALRLADAGRRGCGEECRRAVRWERAGVKWWSGRRGMQAIKMAMPAYRGVANAQATRGICRSSGTCYAPQLLALLLPRTRRAREWPDGVVKAMSEERREGLSGGMGGLAGFGRWQVQIVRVSTVGRGGASVRHDPKSKTAIDGRWAMKRGPQDRMGDGRPG